ncbi:uncharacterized protein A4U43_C04F950 [Asparagus officinalis]|uniref:Cytochrome P450 n=1 Tax=Asparagus officinalis TaxID=4686 RepID=A0A5P1F203_ASPOF|nr:uncharacterized protein A4U43_C04F950 [Asparagus officinalis]
MILVIFYLRGPKRLAPGPRPLPIIGNLHILTSSPHRFISSLTKTYGPIVHLKLGSTTSIFISSPSLIEKLFKNHDIAISNRPPAEALHILSYGFKGFAFTEHGTYWRNVRKLCVHNLLGSGKVESYEFVKREEIESLVDSLKVAAEEKAVVDVTAKVTYFNLIMRRTKAVREKIGRFFEMIINEHLMLREKGQKRKNDFVDVLLDAKNDMGNLESQVCMSSIKAILMEVLIAALDSTSYAIDWAFTELIRHPRIMKKLQDELMRVVGPHRMVEESDIPKLAYLGMVIKESLRLHGLTAFVSRRNRMDISLDGYRIPAGSNITLCSWAVARDPDFWPNAEEFIPERFEKTSPEFKGHDFHYFPFGSGRRICAGMSFGLSVVPLVLAQLAHCFDWRLPHGVSPSGLEMDERFGFIMSRVAHLEATPISRLSI